MDRGEARHSDPRQACNTGEIGCIGGGSGKPESIGGGGWRDG